MSVDLTPIVQGLVGLATAAIVAMIPYVIPLMRQRLHVAITADQQAGLERALNAGAGVAYKFAVGLIDQGGLSNVNVHNAALAMGAQYVAAHFPDTMADLGATPDAVRGAVSARLGTLLASDPTVTAGMPAPPPPAVASVAAADPTATMERPPIAAA